MCAVVCVWREGEGGLVGGIERRRDTGRDTCAAISAQGVNLRANLLAHLRERERERENDALHWFPWTDGDGGGGGLLISRYIK